MNSSQNNLPQKYSKSVIIIHWLTFIFIIILFPLGKYTATIPIAEKSGLIKLHAFLGVLVFLLTIFRSWLHFKETQPAPIKTGNTFNNLLLKIIHSSFYLLLLAISISGLVVMKFGGYLSFLTSQSIEELNNTSSLKVHSLLTSLLMLLFIIHIIGVLKHYLTTKDNPLKRIF